MGTGVVIQAELVNGALTEEQIVSLVTTHRAKRFTDNMRYYRGENPTISDRVLPVVNAPNHKLPVSYARKIIRTVVGYMYKPGLVTYNVDDEAYLDLLMSVFKANNEDTKTSAMGRQASIQGVGYELHYVAGDRTPRFAKVPATDMTVVHSWDIEPEMLAALRFFRRTNDGTDIEVYYSDRVDMFFLPDRANYKDAKLQAKGTEAHEYEAVPVVVFENNEEQVGDFEPVRSLIDAYDILLSDSMNEFDRFAWAYLILKNVKTPEGEEDKVKFRKIIELFDEGEASFLQKDIPSDYIRFMSEWIRKEIHKQTHVPDFTDSTLGTEMTGAAIDRLFYDFEFVAADKEDRFRDGLKRRIKLVNAILRKTQGIVEADDVEIMMGRNKPQMLSELGQTGQFYLGRVSDQTWLENFAPFVENAEEELDSMAGESNPFRGDNGDAGPTDEQEPDREETPTD
jgi:SPP1 family phage portal protein